MGEEDGDEGDSAHRPLAGVVLCCTSIAPEQRTALAAAATVLGAVHKLDLTSDVTHLLVGAWDTPKYRYVARERPDVRCLRPSFVGAVRAAWLEGRDEPPDLAELEAAHRWPALAGGVRVCLTGFQDLGFRRQVEAAVAAAGGEYRGDLTREVTHLVAAEPRGAKYTHAKQWGVRCVGAEWLRDSIERGMVLDEAYYDLGAPPEERGAGAWVREGEGAKRKRDGPEPDRPARKLRRTASARFSQQNSDIWGDIVGGGFVPGEVRRDAWDDAAAAEAQAGAAPSASTEGPRLQRSASASSLRPGSAARALFEGRQFYLHGFGEKQTAVLQRHLLSLKGTILADEPAFVTAAAAAQPPILLVPHAFPGPWPAADPDAYAVVTEFWLEKCLHSKTFLVPGADPLYSPLPAAPLPGFDQLHLSSTGFEDIDLLHVGRAVRALGAAYEGTLSRRVSALVVAESAGREREKVRYARANGIPTLRIGWLWACARRGGAVSAGEHALFEDDAGAEIGKQAAPRDDKAAGGERGGPANPRRSSADLGRRAHIQTAATTFNIEDSFTLAPATDAPAPDKHPLRELPTNPPTRSLTASPPRLPPKAAPALALESALADVLAARRRRHSPPRRAPDSCLAAEPYAAAASPAGAEAAGVPALAQRRRRKSLLGRAASGVSLASVGSANSDGLGTPIGGVSAGESPVKTKAAALAGPEDEADGPGGTEGDDGAEPAATQVSYEDEDARKWRRHIAERQGWEMGLEGLESSDERRLKEGEAERVEDRGKRVYGGARKARR